jgi:hypothetical protein
MNVNVMFSVWLTKYCAMPTPVGWLEVYLHAFLSSALNGGGWSASRPGSEYIFPIVRKMFLLWLAQHPLKFKGRFDIYHYLLPWRIVRLQELIVAQLGKNITAVYGAHNLMIVFTKSHYWTLSRTSGNHFTSSHPTRPILILSFFLSLCSPGDLTTYESCLCRSAHFPWTSSLITLLIILKSVSISIYIFTVPTKLRSVKHFQCRKPR